MPQLIFLMLVLAHLVDLGLEARIVEQPDLRELMLLLIVLGHLVATADSLGQDGDCIHRLHQVLQLRASHVSHAYLY